MRFVGALENNIKIRLKDFTSTVELQALAVELAYKKIYRLDFVMTIKY
jgi:hypothetical protein